jgi:hypothetical protein
MGDFTINCNRLSREMYWLLVESGKMSKIFVKQARNETNPTDDCFLTSLHFAEDLAIIKSDFVEQFDL